MENKLVNLSLQLVCLIKPLYAKGKMFQLIWYSDCTGGMKLLPSLNQQQTLLSLSHQQLRM
jgi:hypothetical protein